MKVENRKRTLELVEGVMEIASELKEWLAVEVAKKHADLMIEELDKLHPSDLVRQLKDDWSEIRECLDIMY